jgi:hypothetical protein
MAKTATRVHSRPPSPPALPRKSFDLAYAGSSTEHRRSSSDTATPTQASQLARPLFQTTSVQDLKQGASTLSVVTKQQINFSPKYQSIRSLTDQNHSPIKTSSPRKKASSPSILTLQSGINNKMHRLAPTTSIGSNPSTSTLSLPTSALSSTLSSNSLISVENRKCTQHSEAYCPHSVILIAWQTLHVFVLPLFNGEQLGQPM